MLRKAAGRGYPLGRGPFSLDQFDPRLGMCVAPRNASSPDDVVAAAAIPVGMRRKRYTGWTFAAAIAAVMASAFLRPAPAAAIGFSSHAISATSHSRDRPQHQIAHARRHDAERAPTHRSHRAALPQIRGSESGRSRSKLPCGASLARALRINPSLACARAGQIHAAQLTLPAAVFHDAHAPPLRRSSSAGDVS
jgi:hypothetical protein